MFPMLPPRIEVCLLFRWVILFLWFFQMIFLPEACDFIGEERSQFVENAEPLNGEIVHNKDSQSNRQKIGRPLT
jgi:hypothetical protein